VQYIIYIHEFEHFKVEPFIAYIFRFNTSVFNEFLPKKTIVGNI